MVVDIPPASDFSIHNLPFGIFSTPDRSPRAGIAVGDHILDLVALASHTDLGFNPQVLHQPVLNDFIRLGKPITSKLRTDIQKWLMDDHSILGKYPKLFVAQGDACLHMPIAIGDYTDFYSSEEHATNVGKLFRDPKNALLPNWKHIPVGYHGRASSIRISGEPIRRPMGQVLPQGSTTPVFKATDCLDFELEMAFIIGRDTHLGHAIPTSQAEDHIFGLVLFNDWSARDIQKWEYIPLGPFLGKNFASSLSPWIVTLEALEPFRVKGPLQQPNVLPYLEYEGAKNFDIHLEVELRPKDSEAEVICSTNFKYMYWNMAQQLAHHSSNGCNVRVGDLLASGTLSGKEKDSYGSLLELTWMGTQPLQMKQGNTRRYLQDHDQVCLRGHAQKDHIRVGFGEVKAQVLPAIPNN